MTLKEWFKKENTKVQENRETKENQIISLSYTLAGHLGHPGESKIEKLEVLKRYDIIKTHRCFTHDWEYLWEIVPKGYNSVGYCNTKNPEWMDENDCQGTTSTNLPPDSVIHDVLEQIREFDGY